MNSVIRASLCLSLILSSLTAENAFSQSKKVKKVEMAAVRPDVMLSRAIADDGILLRDEEGREMEAVLLSAHGENVLIQRVEDDKEFTVPIEVFDARTESVIRDWIEEDRDAVDYSIEISADRIMVEDSTFDYGGRSFTTTKWSYKVSLNNLSRNELNDAVVEYRVVYDDAVNFTRSSALPGEGENQQDGQEVDLPIMGFNEELEFDTPVLEAHTYEYVPVKGEREYSKDVVKGIWVRVLRHGEVISEYKSNEAAFTSLSWDNEDQTEIVIRSKFDDSFTEQ